MAQLVPKTEERYVVALGPIKMEVIHLAGTVNVSDGTTQTGVDDADTVISVLQRPLFAIGSVTSDAVTINLSTNIAISGKTLTVNNANIAADNLAVLVFGF